MLPLSRKIVLSHSDSVEASGSPAPEAATLRDFHRARARAQDARRALARALGMSGDGYNYAYLDEQTSA